MTTKRERNTDPKVNKVSWAPEATASSTGRSAMNEDDIKEIRNNLDTASSLIYQHLKELFGSYKKAPDDHPLLKALDAIGAAHLSLPDEEEDDDEADEVA
jgi:hypothetical protein